MILSHLIVRLFHNSSQPKCNPSKLIFKIYRKLTPIQIYSDGRVLTVNDPIANDVYAIATISRHDATAVPELVYVNGSSLAKYAVFRKQWVSDWSTILV